jgi:endo-1,4-beta-xylanase
MGVRQGLTRRMAILGSAAFVSAVGVRRRPVAEAAGSLKWIASQRGLHYGAAVQATHLQNESDLLEAVARECAAIVPEWEMKWGAMESRRGIVNFARCDAMIDIARSSGLWLRGHTVLWHRNLPNWVEPALAEQADWRIVDGRVSSLMGRYGVDVIPEWDVLNEIIEPEDGRSDGLRENVFLSAFGFDYIPRTLSVARAVAPQARLYINEYGLVYDNRRARARRRAMLRLVEQLRRRNAPLDAIGIQGHLPGAAPFSERALRRFLSELAAMGVKIAVTELDVREQDLTLSVTERDRIVADEVRRFLDVFLAEPAVIGVLTWGISDRHSWLTTAGMRNNGQINRGLPLDQWLVPKPMYDAIAQAMRNAPAR